MLKSNGTKVKGTITKIETTRKCNYKNSIFKKASYFRRKEHHLGGDRDIPYYDYAKVKYNYNNKEYEIDTPYLEFNKEDLIGNEVDVYIYEDKCYVDNYNIKR